MRAGKVSGAGDKLPTKTTAEEERRLKKSVLPTYETINCVIILNYYASSAIIKHLERPY